jgi:hypothetical protein
MQNDNNFDFSGYPKLGRPFKSGSPRDKYVKFYFSEAEMKYYNDVQIKVQKLFLKNGFTFNVPDYFRLFVKFYDHPILLKLFMEDMAKDGLGDGTFKGSLSK